MFLAMKLLFCGFPNLVPFYIYSPSRIIVIWYQIYTGRSNLIILVDLLLQPLNTFANFGDPIARLSVSHSRHARLFASQLSYVLPYPIAVVVEP